jgi:AraC-like DNA-binding protein
VGHRANLRLKVIEEPLTIRIAAQLRSSPVLPSRNPGQGQHHRTITGWRRRVRFHNALEAIARNEPIEKIAVDNGYRSPSAFAAAFRAVIGHAPTRTPPRP